MNGPNVATPLKTGLQRQLVRTDAPLDRTGQDSLPGALASDIYKKRYIKTMTEKEKDKKDNASQEFR